MNLSLGLEASTNVNAFISQLQRFIDEMTETRGGDDQEGSSTDTYIPVDKLKQKIIELSVNGEAIHNLESGGKFPVVTI